MRARAIYPTLHVKFLRRDQNPCGIVTNAEWETHNQMLEPESDPCEERIHIVKRGTMPVL